MENWILRSQFSNIYKDPHDNNKIFLWDQHDRISTVDNLSAIVLLVISC